MKKRFLSVFILFISSFFIFAGCHTGGEIQEETTVSLGAPPVSYTAGYSETTALATEGYDDSNVTFTQEQSTSRQETQISTIPETTLQANTQSDTTTQKVTAVQIQDGTTKVYEKTGEMAFSDSPDNKYIKAICSKYGVDAKNTVALYTVPDNDGNVVLEFNGSKDKNGKLIRNEDTLVAIYSIDKNLNSKCASEDKNKNEYSYGEMKVIYFSTTTYIMPEFEDKL